MISSSDSASSSIPKKRQHSKNYVDATVYEYTLLSRKQTLKLESFGCNNNNRDFVNQHYFRKRFRTCYYYWS